MSAIAGIVCLDGRSVDRSQLQTLAPPVARDRVDALGLWQEGAVGLGHALAAVLPEADRDQQPLRDPESGCVVVFDGRLDNRAELEAAGDLPRSLTGGTDAAAALAAYRRWGEGMLERLLGDFALAVWDPHVRQLLLARDPLGVRSCYYSVRDQRLTFASTLEQLLRDPTLPRDLNDSALVAYLNEDASLLGHQTCFRHIQSLPGGHRLRVRAEGVQLARYWHWPDEPPPHRPATDADREEFRALFTEAVRCRLRSRAPVGLMLSGGLDSGAVASVAGHLQHSSPAPLRAYSVIFEEFASCDERAYSTAAAARYGIPHTCVPADDCWALAHLEEWLPAFVDPLFIPYNGVHLKLMDAIRGDGARVLLMGHGGDHLLTGAAHYLPDWLLQGRWRALGEQVRVQARLSRRSPARTFAADVLAPLLPPRVTRAVRGAVGRRRPAAESRPWLPQGPPGKARRRPNPRPASPRSAWWYALRELWNQFGSTQNQAYLDRTARYFGLELRQPFLDVRLIRFVLRAPPEALYRNGTPKLLLLESLADLLPPLIRERPSRTSLSPLIDRGLRRHRRAFVEALLDDSELERRELVRADAWKSAIRTFLEGDNCHFWSYWRTLTLEMWLRTQVGRLPALK